MTEVSTYRPSNLIGDMLVSSRSLAEYRTFFELTDDDLAKSILDCPGGAASFTAEVNAAGGRVVAADPIYTRSSAEIGGLADFDMRRANQYQLRNPENYVWSYFDSPEHYLRARLHAGELFIRDMAEHPDRYVTAALPQLPFADGQFDLALSSHLLFAYLDRLDRQFHLDSIRELVRVAGELRVFPLLPFGIPENPALPSIVAELNRTGLRATVHDVDYEVARANNQMLRVVRRDG